MISKNSIQIIKNSDNEAICFVCIDDGVNLSVPFDKDNRHFQEIRRLAEEDAALLPNFDFSLYD